MLLKNLKEYRGGPIRGMGICPPSSDPEGPPPSPDCAPARKWCCSKIRIKGIVEPLNNAL